jgi:methylated-DNA-protein-cysteine methyltransferase-like protein
MEEEGFFEKVYKIVRQIPYGRVTTYGIIANYLGTPRSARMVGWALNSSKIDTEIPTHRVVNRKGLLTGKNHFQGTNLMSQLLESEGVIVDNDCVFDLEKNLWYPDKIK